MKKAQLARQASVAMGATALAFGCSTAFGQDWASQDFIKPYDETVQINLGGIVNQFDTSLRIDGQNTHGTDINLENNGLKKNLSSFEAGLQWRFAQRHRFDADYYTVSRSGSHSYSGDISIGGDDFPVGATVGMHNKFDLFSLDYRYSFVQQPDYEVAGLVGFYGGKFTFDVNAVGAIGSNGVGTTYNNSVSTTLPLPMLGASWDWYLSPQAKIAVMGMGMKAKISNVDGHAYVVGVNGDYMLTRNLGLGARYTYVDISADVDKSSFDGNFSWRVNTFSLYAKLLF
ncbi:MAG TPA: hypothetical protein VKR38_06805 [Usitatibacter sp.]|nr:hypothetical protein [Usitatibacter sp.]